MSGSKTVDLFLQKRCEVISYLLHTGIKIQIFTLYKYQSAEISESLKPIYWQYLSQGSIQESYRKPQHNPSPKLINLLFPGIK